MRIYDISRRISEQTAVWPGDVPFSWRETEIVGEGEEAPEGEAAPEAEAEAAEAAESAE